MRGKVQDAVARRACLDGRLIGHRSRELQDGAPRILPARAASRALHPERFDLVDLGERSRQRL